MCASGLVSPLSVARRAALSAAPGLVPPRSIARAPPCAVPSRLLSSTAAGGGASASRLRGPITWVSAVVTITGLYSLYQYQYNKQLNRQKSVGKPELGGPFTLMDVDGKTVSNTDLMGQWVLIYFGFTKCPDICPEEMAKARGLPLNRNQNRNPNSNPNPEPEPEPRTRARTRTPNPNPDPSERR